MDKEEEKVLTEEVIEEEATENSSLSNGLENKSEDEENVKEIARQSVLNPINLNGLIKDIKAQTKKGFLKLIKKHPYIIAIFIIIFIIIMGILIFAMDFDVYGKGKPNLTYYYNRCDKIFLTWESEIYYNAHKDDEDYEPITDANLVDLEFTDANKIKRWEYKEYSYHTYITGIIWSDNDQAKDVDNESVYQAMAIVARSRLISTLSDNCVVLKNYNEQAKSFVELTGSESKYSEISEAVTNTEGIIIGRNGKIIEALYDPFSYTKKILIEDSNYNQKYFYHMMHENKEKQQLIHASWVDELEEKKGVEIPKVKVSETKFLESLSLYGAKYLQEHEDYDYDLYRILETYYGRDIEYYTIDYESSDKTPIPGPIANGCYVWPIGSKETKIENNVETALGFPSSIKITSWFGEREAPIKDASTNHGAIDISGNGTRGVYNIIASQDGVVTYVKTNCVEGNVFCGGGYGNYVKIDHGNGIETRYAHMFSVSVSVGDKVVKGQVLGKLGNTGRSTGPHLHFEVRDHNTKVNPLNYVSPNDPRPTNCGGGITPVPIPGGDNKQITCLALKRAGYGNQQVAGMMANAQHESGFDPTAFNPSGGGMGAYGLFQWRAGRQKALKALKNYDTIEVQVAFAATELSTGYQNANMKLINSTSPSDASYNFCVYYEVPGRTTEEAKRNCLVRKNDGLADKHYVYAQNGCK